LIFLLFKVEEEDKRKRFLKGHNQDQAEHGEIFENKNKKVNKNNNK
jgi:hypothetical protein